MGGLLGVQTRRSIFETIKDSPGLHLRELARRLGFKTSLVEYHVRELISHGLVTEAKEEGYRRFYPSEDPSSGTHGFSAQHRRVLHFLRQDVPLRIVVMLLDKGGCTHKELLACSWVSASTLSYHLSRLQEARIVEKYRDEWGKGFRLIAPKEVLWLIVRGKMETATVVDGMLATFDEFY